MLCLKHEDQMNTLEGKGHKWHSDTWKLNSWCHCRVGSQYTSVFKMRDLPPPKSVECHYNGISRSIFRCLNVTYALFPLRYYSNERLHKKIEQWLFKSNLNCLWTNMIQLVCKSTLKKYPKKKMCILSFLAICPHCLHNVTQQGIITQGVTRTSGWNTLGYL